MKQYIDICKDILQNGVQKSDRTGTGTRSIFGTMFKHDMREGFPLLTTKKMATKQIVSELLWFMSGNTNIVPLVKQGNYIWVDDCYRAYKQRFSLMQLQNVSTQGCAVINRESFIEALLDTNRVLPQFGATFGDVFGSLGPVYGKQWRNVKLADFDTSFASYFKWLETNDDVENATYRAFTHTTIMQRANTRRQNSVIDQLQNVVDMLRKNPDDRRMIVTSWSPGEFDTMVLPPCHFVFQFNSVEIDGQRYLSLAWTQRSVDVGLGLPFNIASYGLLLHIIANIVGMKPLYLIGNLGDTHVYNDHIDLIQTQTEREPLELCNVNFNNVTFDVSSITAFLTQDFPDDWVQFDNYTSHSTIRLPLST